MPITFPLTPPAAFLASSETWRPISQNAVTTSPWTLSQQVQQLQGNAWEVDIMLPPMDRPSADAVNAFLTALGGASGTFYYGPTIEATCKGVATGTPLVMGSGQSGIDLVTDGWTHGVTGILKAGDFIGAGGYLYKILADANSDSSGNATLTLFPAIRPSLADNTAIVVSSPKSVFYTTSQAEWSIDTDKIYGMKLTARERIFF